MRRVLATALLGLALVAGCGSDDDEEPERPAETSSRTTAEQPESDETQIRKLTVEYYAAVAERDWKGVCATLSPRARKRLDRKAGSCERAYRTTVARKAVRLSRELTAGDVRVNGDRATVKVVLRGDDARIDTLYAAKIDGRWWFYIRRAAKGAK